MPARPAPIAMLAACLLGGCVVPPPLLAVAAPPPPPADSAAPPASAPPLARVQSPDPPDRQRLLAGAGFSPLPGADGAAPARLELPDGVLFDSGSDRPLPGAAAVLQRLATAERQAGASLTVLGHTDAVGSDAYNLDLSARRAQAVIAMLAADGVDPSAMSAVAIGRRQPLASNATASGRARNRRVEFLLGDDLAANLAVVRASGSGTVAVLQPDRQAGAATLAVAGQIALARPLAEVAVQSVAGGAQHRRPEPAPPLRVNHPEPVHRAPLADTPSY